MEEKRLSKRHDFRLVEGKNVKVRELPDWSADKLLSFVKFFQFFINPETDKMRVNQERIEEFEAKSEVEPYFMEWRARIGLDLDKIRKMPLQQKMTTLNTYKMRVLTMQRNVLGWMRNNPHMISLEMRDLMCRSERMSWALKDFKIEDTLIGAPIVVPDNRETTDPEMANVDQKRTNLTIPELNYQRAVTQLAAIASDLTKGLKKKDLDKMTAKDRISAAINITSTLAKVMSAHKPQQQVFKQLVIHKAGAEELEKAMLDYNSNQ
jgi:hypothetical protein